MARVQDYTGMYGPDWREGVLSEHVHRAVGDGCEERQDGDRHYIVDAYGATVTVVCSELIRVYTEDGPITGRCGAPVDKRGYACEGHADEIEHYRSMSEVERWAGERRDADR